MTASTAKKVLLVRFDREALRGYVIPNTYLQPEGIELLSPEGGHSVIPYTQVKAVCFVQDWDGRTLFAERTQFISRPKPAGLWIQFTLRDGAKLQGLLPNDLLQVDGVGFLITPPDSAGNTQRAYIPRAALRDVLILGVVGVKSPLKKQPEPQDQFKLFSEDSPS